MKLEAMLIVLWKMCSDFKELKQIMLKFVINLFMDHWQKS